MNTQFELSRYLNGNFSDQNIQIIWVPTKNQKELEITQISTNEWWKMQNVTEYIDPIKAQLTKRGKPYEDETIVAVDHIDMNSGKLYAYPISRKTQKVLATEDFCKSFPKYVQDIPVGLHVSMMVLTRDNQLVFSPRENNKNETLETPSGMFGAIDLDASTPLLSGVMRETNEELGPLQIYNTEFLGASVQGRRALMTVYMVGQMDVSADDLNEYRAKNSWKIKDYDKFTKLECIPIENIETALYTSLYTDNKMPLNSTAFVSAALFGMHEFGKDWAKKYLPTGLFAQHTKEQIFPTKWKGADERLLRRLREGYTIHTL